MKQKIEFYAQRTEFNQSVDIYMRTTLETGIYAIARPVTLERYPHENEIPLSSPMLELQPDSAQQLIDELWRCGLRPTEGTGSAGSLAATERHLKDMQRISKGLLKKFGADIDG